MNKLPTEIISEVVRLRQSGLSFKEVADSLKISSNQAQHAARLGGVVKKKPDEALLSFIREQRAAGITVEEIAKQHDISRGTVIKHTKDVAVKSDKAAIISDYLIGVSFSDLAVKYGLAERSVQSVIHRAGVSNRRPVIHSSSKEEARSMRISGVSVYDTATQLKMSNSSVKRSTQGISLKKTTED